jgi:putative spermidine/putrescine transport system permease protein
MTTPPVAPSALPPRGAALAAWQSQIRGACLWIEVALAAYLET